MNTAARDRLKHTIRLRYEQSGLPLSLAQANASVAVSLDEYFTGNDGRNCYKFGVDPTVFEAWRQLLYAICVRADVQNVFVEISDACFDEHDEWPSSDTVYVLTSAGMDAVEKWIEPMQGCLLVEIKEGYLFGVPPIGAPALAPGMRVVKLWWD